MINQIERLLLAATISLACLSFSYYWYSKGKNAFEDNILTEPIARLATTSNEVHRKRAKRVIWQAINKGELLYEREAIRTMAGASAEIIFNDSDTRINLDPDSVIVLEKTGTNVSLNFLKGNIFVSGSSADSKLAIKAGGNTIQAGSSELNLSKGKNQKDVNLQVLKGKATVESNGETIELNKNEAGKLGAEKINIEKNLIEILSPISNEKLYVNLKNKEPLKFSWKKLDADYKVYLLVGDSPDNLQRLKNVVANGNVGDIYSQIEGNKFYWRFEAESDSPDKPKLTSTLLKNKIVAIRSPIFISPKKKAKIALKKTEAKYEIEWTNPMGLKEMQLQVWRSKNRKMVEGSQESFNVVGTKHTYDFKKSGIYAARVTGFLKKGSEDIPVSSITRKFKVRLADELAPPELELPTHEAYLSHTKVTESGIFLTWSKAPSAKKYSLTLFTPGKEQPETKELYDESYRIEEAQSGIYKWTVASINKKGKVSKASEQRSFTVEDVPRLRWKVKQEQSDSYYFGDQAKLDVAWRPLDKQGVTYKVSYAAKGEWQEAQSQETKEGHLIVDVPEPGFYETQVQALNSKGKLLAQTNKRSIKVTEFPFLPPPEFSEDLPQLVKADSRGNVTLKWSKVKGAKKYILRVKGKDKSLVKELKITGQQTKIPSLLPGKYRVFVYAEDRYGRLSKEADKRSLSVGNRSDIRAPSGFKGIKVKGIKFK